MTVASLWKALDRAGCGRPVGAEELRDHHRLRTRTRTLEKTNPWNYNQHLRQQNQMKRNIPPNHRPTLAVDLSIWICEALTSSAMKNNQISDPACSLVYTRVLRLLNLGIKLVVVVEGKRRVRHQQSEDQRHDEIGKDCLADKCGHDGGGRQRQQHQQHQQLQQGDKFRKRRGGAPFWSACQRCEKMLLQMGVPVVRAKAEGEALCGLLNQRGVVDGVITKDGDCFLFGAKVLYTKFSIENLEQKRVMRYDIDDLHACVDDDDGSKFDAARQIAKDGRQIVKLSRDDLIAFAILTGSDLAGDGISMVGSRKAIRFIRKCQIDNPLKVLNDKDSTSPALELLKSWEKLAIRFASTAALRGGGHSDNKSESSSRKEEEEGRRGPTCSCCGHAGTKTSHKKHGCTECDTGPGEECIFLSPGTKFKESLQPRVMELPTNFGPMKVSAIYHNPNDNQLPLSLVGMTSRKVQMHTPRFDDLMKSSFIIRGRSQKESRAYLQKSIAPYMARLELFRQLDNEQDLKIDDGSSSEGRAKCNGPKNTNRAVPVQLNGRRVKNGKVCFEVLWMVKATTTDDNGNPVDEFAFSTFEQESMIKKCFPILLQNFETQQNHQRQKLCNNQQNPLESFLKSTIDLHDTVDGEGIINNRKNNNTKKKIRNCGHQKRTSLERPKAKHLVGGPSDDLVNLGLLRDKSAKTAQGVIQRRTSEEAKNKAFQQRNPEHQQQWCSEQINHRDPPLRYPNQCVARTLFQSEMKCAKEDNNKKEDQALLSPDSRYDCSGEPSETRECDFVKRQCHHPELSAERYGNMASYQKNHVSCTSSDHLRRKPAGVENGHSCEIAGHKQLQYHTKDSLRWDERPPLPRELHGKCLPILDNLEDDQEKSCKYDDMRWDDRDEMPDGVRGEHPSSSLFIASIDEIDQYYDDPADSYDCFQSEGLQNQIELYEWPDELSHVSLQEDRIGHQFSDGVGFDHPRTETPECETIKTENMIFCMSPIYFGADFYDAQVEQMFDSDIRLSSPLPKRTKYGVDVFHSSNGEMICDNLASDRRSNSRHHEIESQNKIDSDFENEINSTSRSTEDFYPGMRVDSTTLSGFDSSFSKLALEGIVSTELGDESFGVLENLQDMQEDLPGFENIDREYPEEISAHSWVKRASTEFYPRRDDRKETHNRHEGKFCSHVDYEDTDNYLHCDIANEEYPNEMTLNTYGDFEDEDFCLAAGSCEKRHDMEMLRNDAMKSRPRKEGRQEPPDNQCTLKDNSTLGHVLSKIIEAEVKRRIAIEMKSLDYRPSNEYM